MLPTTPSSASLSPERFGTGLIAALVELRRQRIPMGDPRIEQALGEMLIRIRQRAASAYQSGNKEFAFTLLDLLEELSPDPSTGAYDAFWALFRRLQPAPISVPNPLYPALEINLTPAHAAAGMAELTTSWQEIVRESAEQLARVL